MRPWDFLCKHPHVNNLSVAAGDRDCRLSFRSLHPHPSHVLFRGRGAFPAFAVCLSSATCFDQSSETQVTVHEQSLSPTGNCLSPSCVLPSLCRQPSQTNLLALRKRVKVTWKGSTLASPSPHLQPAWHTPSFTLENHQLSELQSTVKEILRELKQIQASQPNVPWRRLTYVLLEIVAQDLKALSLFLVYCQGL